jgi:ATP-binding cassette subfamily B protein
MMAVVPVLMIVVILYGRFTRRLGKEYQDALAKAADTGAESISNARIMKSFGAENFENLQYYRNITNSYRKGSIKAFAYGIFAGGIGFFAGFAILVVVYYGATLVIHDELQVGDLTAFILYTFYIAINMGIISSLYTEFMNALGASERVFKILDTEPKIPFQGGEKPQRCDGDIEFKNISFAYPTRQDSLVLKNFSFRVKPNQTVALVGASGSGRSLCSLNCLLIVQHSLTFVIVRKIDVVVLAGAILRYTRGRNLYRRGGHQEARPNVAAPTHRHRPTRAHSLLGIDSIEYLVRNCQSSFLFT